MEGIQSLDPVLKLISNFGLPGLVLVLWFFSDKGHEKTLKQYREDVVEQRRVYEEGLQEVRRMYESNVVLIRNYEGLAGALKDIVTINTRSWQRVCDDINRNQYCPMVRLKKDTAGVLP